VLAGVIRGQVLAAAHRLGGETEEVEDAIPMRLHAGVFLTNSLIGVRPVAQIDGQAVAPHALVAALKAALAAVT
jgi:branched-chain amino acid aminotransferase/4-amino-4-deoxychorismate lyase